MARSNDSDRPNVLLVVADDQRFDTIGALGNDRVETPHLDSLVEDGCAFTRAHNAGADQGAVCVPARGMLLSGRHLFDLDGPGDVPIGHPTLPETFGNADYRTFGTGKWHNGIDAFDRSFAEGESIFFGGMGNHWNVPVCSRHPDGEYPPPRPHRFDPGTGRLRTVPQVYDRYASGTHSSELFASTAVEFLREHADDERPFFAYVATMAPHDPRTAPGEYLARYDPESVPLPESFRPEHPFDNGSLRIRDEMLAGMPREPDEIRRHVADYYAMITHLDAQIGRILETLESIGERENTIVAFTADHGLAVGRHGLMGKQNLYDHSVRVPLLFSGPGIPAGERRDAFTYHHDLYPTLCDLADLSAPETIDGQSLVPAIEGGDGPRDSVFLAYEDTQRAVRGDRFKLIEYYVDGDRHTQLFDLAADPAETTDLSDDDAYAAERERLRDLLSRRQAELGDPIGSDR